jgi:glutaredoxin
MLHETCYRTWNEALPECVSWLTSAARLQLDEIPMASTPFPVTIDFYRRRDCPVCDEARLTLQQVLEDRALRSEPSARVRYIDVDTDAQLRDSHGPRVPVLAAAGRELSLASGYRQIARFVDAALGRMA